MSAARFIVAGALLCFGTAAADDKVDAAKTKTCEKTKKFLVDQKAKGKCAAEADEAAKLTCSAATYKPMTELLQRCTRAKPENKGTVDDDHLNGSKKLEPTWTCRSVVK